MNKNIALLDCEIELILQSLEFYIYTLHYIYPRRRKSETEEQNMYKSLIRDTYEHLTEQFVDSKRANLTDINVSRNYKKIKKIE